MNSEPILYSILELATISAGSTASDSFKNALDLAQKAEQVGYHRMWLAEHHNMISIASSATSVLIGYVAAGTETLRVGSGGIMLPNHSPLIVAEQFATLATLYPGRIDLGLGRAPGTDQTTAQAIRSDRMQAVYQFPEEIEKIHTYFSRANAGAKVRVPFAEGLNLPMYVLGSSTDSAHVAAAKGLPYAFASHFAPAQLYDAFSIYHNSFTPSDQLEKPYTIACINVIAADSDEEAEKLATSLLQVMISVMSGKPEYMQPPVEPNAETRALFQHPGLQRMLKYAFIGSKETLKAKTKEFIESTGVDEVMAVSHIYDSNYRINSFRIFAEVMKEINMEKINETVKSV